MKVIGFWVLFALAKVIVYTKDNGPVSSPLVEAAIDAPTLILSSSARVAVTESVLMAIAGSDGTEIVATIVSLFSKSASSIIGTEMEPVSEPIGTEIVEPEKDT